MPDKPMSSALVRRLAEAADGYRNRGPVYFLARRNPPKESPRNFGISKGYKEPYEEKDREKLHKKDREKLDKVKGGEFEWFGPYVTDEDRKPTVKITKIVIHVKVPDPQDPTKTIDLTKDIQTEFSNEDEAAEEPFDAMFWSISALEKFAFGYYAQMNGGAYIDEMMTRFTEVKDTKDGMFLLAHRPGTEYDNPDAPLPAIGLVAKDGKLKFEELTF